MLLSGPAADGHPSAPAAACWRMPHRRASRVVNERRDLRDEAMLWMDEVRETKQGSAPNRKSGGTADRFNEFVAIPMKTCFVPSY